MLNIFTLPSSDAVAILYTQTHKHIYIHKSHVNSKKHTSDTTQQPKRQNKTKQKQKKTQQFGICVPIRLCITFRKHIVFFVVLTCVCQCENDCTQKTQNKKKLKKPKNKKTKKQYKSITHISNGVTMFPKHRLCCFFGCLTIFFILFSIWTFHKFLTQKNAKNFKKKNANT